MLIDGLHITVAQINPIVGDLDYNTAKILECWQSVSEENNILLFPELCVSGYPPEDLILKPSYIDAVAQYVARIAEASRSLHGAAIIGAPIRKAGKIYNAALTIAQGKIIAETYKHHLPNYDVFDEKRVFDAGGMPDAVEYAGRKLGIMVCEDMWFDDVARHLQSQGAEILLILNASPFDVYKDAQRLTQAQSRVSETGLPLLYVNQVGGQDELVFDGASFAMDANGTRIYQAVAFEEVTEALEVKTTPNDEPVYSALVIGVRDYVRKNGFPGVVLGLSGGIDSALAAVIAVEALGSENVHCVMMPSEFTSKESLDDAAELAEALGCQYDILPIGAAMDAFENTIPNLSGVAHENMQSRTRGLILMALSNSSGKMLLTTGNKSEMAVGYATLYGDMNGGFNALKDLYKTQVFEISRTKEIIPRRIIERPPSAELRADQTDQDSLPDYEVLDAILACLIECEMSVEETIAKTDYERDLILRIWQMLDRAEYKRYQAAPGTKITVRAFGRDRRYPMTNGFVKSVQA